MFNKLDEHEEAMIETSESVIEWVALLVIMILTISGSIWAIFFWR